MTVTQTSIAAHRTRDHESERLRVLACIRLYGPICMADIAERLHMPDTGRVAARMVDLKEAGIIEYVDTRPSKSTGRPGEHWQTVIMPFVPKQFPNNLFGE